MMKVSASAPAVHQGHRLPSPVSVSAAVAAVGACRTVRCTVTVLSPPAASIRTPLGSAVASHHIGPIGQDDLLDFGEGERADAVGDSPRPRRQFEGDGDPMPSAERSITSRSPCRRDYSPPMTVSLPMPFSATYVSLPVPACEGLVVARAAILEPVVARIAEILGAGIAGPRDGSCHCHRRVKRGSPCPPLCRRSADRRRPRHMARSAPRSPEPSVDGTVPGSRPRSCRCEFGHQRCCHCRFHHKSGSAAFPPSMVSSPNWPWIVAFAAAAVDGVGQPFGAQ